MRKKTTKVRTAIKLKSFLSNGNETKSGYQHLNELFNYQQEKNRSFPFGIVNERNKYHLVLSKERNSENHYNQNHWITAVCSCVC